MVSGETNDKMFLVQKAKKQKIWTLCATSLKLTCSVENQIVSVFAFVGQVVCVVTIPCGHSREAAIDDP